VGTLRQGAHLLADVHAADAGRHARTGLGIEPGQLALDLEREFTGRRDDQRERLRRVAEALFAGEELFGKGEPKGDRLAGAGLCGHEQVAAARVGFKDGRLDGGGQLVTAFGQRRRQQGGQFGKRHHASGIRGNRGL
jgi:hypothetical protein